MQKNNLYRFIKVLTLAIFFLVNCISRAQVFGRDISYSVTKYIPGKDFFIFNNNVKRSLLRGFPYKNILGKKVYRRLIAVSFNPKNGKLYAATKFNIYYFSNKKNSWQQFTNKGLHLYASISSLLAVDNTLYLGTTCYGVYKFNGSRWVQISSGLPGEEPSHLRKFYETVTSLALSGDKTLYAGMHFNRGVYKLHKYKKRWKKVNFRINIPRIASIYPVSNSVCVFDGKNWISDKDDIKIPYFLKKAAKYYPKYDSSYAVKYKQYTVSFTKPEFIRRKSSGYDISGKKGLYINPWQAKPHLLLKKIKKMKTSKMNSLVIDVKDDYGRVLYNGKINTVKAVNAYYPILNIKEIVSICKKYKIHLIARMVTFKDPRLHKFMNFKYAVKDKYNKGPWHPGSREKWVDPFNNFVRSYNIKIAKEIIKLGFDEIQFDYIRFPTDGPLYRAYYPSRKKNEWKLDALENFLALARQTLKKPFSVDIYGFNAWFSLGKWMGQDVVMFSKYVDAISPMHYPSHFDKTFRIERGFKNRTFDILYYGTKRPIILTQGKVGIRPYLQAFRWRAYNYGLSYWHQQVLGVFRGGSDGYIFWDAASKYPYLKFFKPFKLR